MRVLLALVMAAAFAASIPSARAEDWCGFLDKEHARVRCGYSTITECKQSLGDNKNAICIPDPSFAERERRVHPAASRS